MVREMDGRKWGFFDGIHPWQEQIGFSSICWDTLQGDISYMYVQRFGFKLVIAQLPLQPSYDPVITQLQPRQNLGDIPYTTG